MSNKLTQDVSRTMNMGSRWITWHDARLVLVATAVLGNSARPVPNGKANGQATIEAFRRVCVRLKVNPNDIANAQAAGSNNGGQYQLRRYRDLPAGERRGDRAEDELMAAPCRTPSHRTAAGRCLG
ncbi:MAG: hypothetical protein LBR80_15760 [Deltaproteobacteria bacterium]|nr:hypothetical protein [Deltaproteobacteria bacterium]